MGEGLSPDTQVKLKQLIEADEDVIEVSNMLSTYQSPKEVLLMLTIAFNADLNTKGLTDAIERLRQSIQSNSAIIKYVIIQPRSCEQS